MQTSKITACQDCNLLQAALQKLDLKLWEVAEKSLVQKKYNLREVPSTEIAKDLIRYKRILQRRLVQPTYPCSDFTNQDIIQKTLSKIQTSKHCLCFYQSPQ